MESSQTGSDPTTSAKGGTSRRHDVDWLRTLAMGLLIIYHVVLSFQPWASAIMFPQSPELLEGLWIGMALINVWRIPILFLISGMGVRFAMERRDWMQLLKDRTLRIVVPFVFGTYILGGLFAWILPSLGWDAPYTLHFGHLWFLANIFAYVLWLIGIIIYVKDHPDCALLRFFRRLLRWRYGVFLVAIPVVLEAALVNPLFFATYVDTVHGWLIGLICFFLGFAFICIQDVFWPAVERVRREAILISFSLYLVRMVVFRLAAEPNWMVGLESMMWMLGILGFASVYLNRPSRSLSYLSKAVYPVYILHLPVQFLAAYYLFPLGYAAFANLLLLLVATFGVSLLLYEVVLRRLKWIRPLFGMKWSG